MLREAELFVMADQMLAEVLGRIRPTDGEIRLPAMYPGADRPVAMAVALARQVWHDASVAAVLTGGRAAGQAVADVASAAATACAAARGVIDVPVQAYGGELAVGGYLLRVTLERSLLAHYVAAYLGSTACPLPEELARPLWELTEPEAARWRELGYFREPLPLPPDVSWRDRFLLTAGHQPHPLGH